MQLRRLASQSALYGLSSIIGRLINWLLTPYFVHHFSLSDFGAFSDLYAWMFYPQILLTLGLETSFFRFSQNTESADKNYANSTWAIFLLSCCFGIVIISFNPFISKILGYSSNPEWVLLVAGIIILDCWAALPMAKLRYDQKAKQFVFTSLVSIAITLLLSILFVTILSWGVSGALLANLIASLVRLLCALYQNLPNPYKLSLKKVQQLGYYGSFIMVAGLVGSLNETLDRNLLPRLWKTGWYFGAVRTGLELNAIYSANYKLGMIITLVSQAFRYAADPIFFKNIQNKNSQTFLARSFFYFVLLCLLAFFIISSFSFEIVSFHFWGLTSKTLLPNSYWVGIKAIPLILLANVFLATYYQLSIWFKITGQLRFGLFFAIIGALITIFGNVVFIPYFGFIACAWATFFCYLTMTVLCYLVGQQYYRIPYPIKRISGYAILLITASLLNQKLTTIGIFNLNEFMLKMLISILAISIIGIIESKKPIAWPT
ncbi:MAG: oligosaccharide flippase family protein [Bacteroidia bacterium]|nr:oligosaccharide flippase family protein [Bacteroidia bacterium]